MHQSPTPTITKFSSHRTLMLRNVRLAQYPGALALFHERFLHVFVNLILGWDWKKQRPFKRGGIFGHVRAFMGPNEEQARLSLHIHLIIWLYGHNKLMQRMRNPQARQDLQSFLDNAISAMIPWPSSDVADKAHTCLAAECKDNNSKLNLDEAARCEARKVNLPKRGHPALLKCESCGSESTPRDQCKHASSNACI